MRYGVGVRGHDADDDDNDDDAYMQWDCVMIVRKRCVEMLRDNKGDEGRREQ